ncbi:MAG: transglycosylase SLT domain-containing protein [Armatimonadetes bacterium]|nr:transglycosylase SLT domain-containing protein [Armatimonadota bacterium]
MTCTVVEGRILAENRNGNYRFYRSDALGSTVSLYDSSQNKTDSFTYWPYGETRTSSGSTGTKYKYVGTLGCRTQHDGGIYMRARVMRPKDGRWQTVDPLWPSEPEFAYAGCSPTTLADPSGFQQRYERPITRPPANKREEWLKCMSEAIKRHCSDLNEKFPGAYSRIYAYAWCIIEGESSWNPAERTEFAGGCAYGLFQLTDKYADKYCKEFGYPRYQTDPCSNIGCGVAKLCECLRSEGSIRDCGPVPWNYVDDPRFSRCLREVFNIRL